MKIIIPKSRQASTRSLLRSAGYAEEQKWSGQISYTRSASTGQFPRFHAYLEDQGTDLVLSLHLDQKGASYNGHTAHSGEYDGPLVAQEMRRLEGFFLAPESAEIQKSSLIQLKQPKKRSWIARLLGW